MKRLVLIAAILGILALAPAQAHAGLLVLNYSGTFSADTTLGGTPLGADMPFTLAATFDPSTDQESGTGAGRFDATLRFDITDFGDFVSAPGAGVRLQLTDPTGNGLNVYQLGLLDSLGSEIDPLYSTASPPFSADSPSPSVLSGFLNTLYVVFSQRSRLRVLPETSLCLTAGSPLSVRRPRSPRPRSPSLRRSPCSVSPSLVPPG